MPNPNQPRSEGRFATAKIATEAVMFGAIIAPAVEVFVGKDISPELPKFVALAAISAVGRIALSVADRVLPNGIAS